MNHDEAFIAYWNDICKFGAFSPMAEHYGIWVSAAEHEIKAETFRNHAERDGNVFGFVSTASKMN